MGNSQSTSIAAAASGNPGAKRLRWDPPKISSSIVLSQRTGSPADPPSVVHGQADRPREGDCKASRSEPERTQRQQRGHSQAALSAGSPSTLLLDRMPTYRTPQPAARLRHHLDSSLTGLAASHQAIRESRPCGSDLQIPSSVRSKRTGLSDRNQHACTAKQTP